MVVLSLWLMVMLPRSARPEVVMLFCMLDEVVDVFFNSFAGFLFLSCEFFGSCGAEFLTLGRGDTDCTSGGNEGFEFLVVHLGDVFAFEFMEGDVREKVLEVVGGFHLNGEVEIVDCGV